MFNRILSTCERGDKHSVWPRGIRLRKHPDKQSSHCVVCSPRVAGAVGAQGGFRLTKKVRFGSVRRPVREFGLSKVEQACGLVDVYQVETSSHLEKTFL